MTSEPLLRDLFILLDACFAAARADDLDAIAERTIDSLCTRVGATTGLLWVRDPERGDLVALPERRAALLALAPAARAHAEQALGAGSPAVDALEPAVAGTRARLSIPVPPDAVLELYSAAPAAFQGRTPQVLASLAPWLAAEVRRAAAAGRTARAHAAERAAHERLAELLASLPGVVWRFDAAGRATFVSSRARELLGWTEGDGDEHPRERGLSATDRARIRDETAAAAQAKLESLTLAYRYTHGTRRQLLDVEEHLAFTYQADGALAATTGFVTDVTAARAAHRRMEELSAQRTADARADALRVDAARASHAKSEFLNLLSHELRAPLFPIIALSDLLLRTDDARLSPTEWRDQVRMINGAGKQMLQLVGDLLDISRVDAGRARPNPGPMALTHFVAALRERAEERARGRGVKLTVELHTEGHGADVYTDRSVLDRVASALIAFAVESLDSREVQVAVIAAPAHVGVRLTALATAPPQLPEHADDVFEPFWERPADARAESRGHGLALTLVRRLALAFGGTATARIEPDRRVFEATVPCAYPTATRARARPPRALFGSAELGAVFGAALSAQALGADVRIVGSAAELVEELKKHPPDLLFVDARLPALRVVEDLLRAERGGKRRPRVVALVRSAEPFAVSSALADEVVPLPVTQDRIATALARF